MSERALQTLASAAISAPSFRDVALSAMVPMRTQGKPISVWISGKLRLTMKRLSQARLMRVRFFNASRRRTPICECLLEANRYPKGKSKLFEAGSSRVPNMKSTGHTSNRKRSRRLRGSAATGHAANPVDDFVQRRLIKEGLTPSLQAEPAVLLRRLSLDLVGLPPSLKQVMAFEEDPSGENYEAAIDRLLKSKHFGEKWALHWLDLARYADSNGYQHDDLRTMWPYRDWVIDALNKDLPFDEFTIEQLAGDLLPNPSRDQIIATGFHRNVPTNFSGGSKVNEVRADVLHDRVSTTGQVWLGMTMECCQCHDHKFDPISQEDYYKLYAYFNQAVPELSTEGPGMFRKKFIGADVPVAASQGDVERVKAINEQITLEVAALERAKPAAMAEQVVWEKRFLASGRGETIPWERFAWNQRGGYRILQTTPRNKRSEDDELQVRALLFYDHRFTGPYEKAIDRLTEARDELVARAMVMKDAPQPVATHVFLRGNYMTPGKRVEVGVPEVLHPLDGNLPANRLGLARWIVDPENPLTARVTVNRFWAEIFGKGIVTTPEDFGMQSAPPTHPELLDWLALEFVRQGLVDQEDPQDHCNVVNVSSNGGRWLRQDRARSVECVAVQRASLSAFW